MYDGIHDSIGNYVRYIQDVEVVCFAQHHSVVMTAFLQFKDRLKANRQTLTDFAKSTPFAASDIELTRQNSDLVMPGPFSEPDGYFIRRQARAYASQDILNRSMLCRSFQARWYGCCSFDFIGITIMRSLKHQLNRFPRFVSTSSYRSIAFGIPIQDG